MYKFKGKYRIYVIKNRITGKTYVGCSLSPEERLQKHLYDLRKHRHPIETMQSDFDIYGAGSFEFRTLMSSDDKWEASRLETFIMKILKSQNPLFGYNYKDRKGNSPLAIADRWRTTPRNWSNNQRVSQYINHGVLLPPCY